MKALFIEGNRSGYAPEQCGDTLTVKELIEILGQFDDDSPVYIRNDEGYTYGHIRDCDINPDENIDEE